MMTGKKDQVAFVWLRRDLRLEDNTALNAALASGFPVQLLFIFDEEILNELSRNDARVGFIYQLLKDMDAKIRPDSSLLIRHGKPIEVWKDLVSKNEISTIYYNHDYEPYAIKRDKAVSDLLEKQGIMVKSFKDQVIFEKDEVIKADGGPYTVFTPYKNKWLSHLKNTDFNSIKPDLKNLTRVEYEFPELEDLGFKHSTIHVPHYSLELDRYAKLRDTPSIEGTSRLGPYLRFGAVSIRELVERFRNSNPVFLSELIWREFFMQILYHFPNVVAGNFRSKYDEIKWRNNEEEFEKWKRGVTGFPLVDAGMRELNQTGFMHNRVRMVTAGFLCKDLLIDWRWGEAYFAEKLLDYDLASNNGNWQWAAGTGCDAAPYFRVFNPETQMKRFDPELKYIKKWVPEFGTHDYPLPMVDHKQARLRAIEFYKTALN